MVSKLINMVQGAMINKLWEIAQQNFSLFFYANEIEITKYVCNIRSELQNSHCDGHCCIAKNK